LKISMLQEERQKAKLELQRYEAFYNDLLQLKKEGFDNKSEISAAEEKVAVLREQHKEANGRFESYKEHVYPALLESAGRKAERPADARAESPGRSAQGSQGSSDAGPDRRQGRGPGGGAGSVPDRTGKTVIKAPQDGIVIHYETFRDGEKRKPREGDSVFMGQPILYLPDISKMIVKTRVREVDLFKLSLGQKGVVRVDAYPDTAFKGDLTFIGALATSEAPGIGAGKIFSGRLHHYRRRSPAASRYDLPGIDHCPGGEAGGGHPEPGDLHRRGRRLLLRPHRLGGI